MNTPTDRSVRAGSTTTASCRSPLLGREEELAAAFAAARRRLTNVAYAIVGGYADAEDVVSECWPRLLDADRREPVRDVEAWTIVAVSRAALDVLRSARRRRETYPGVWLPEPVVESLAHEPSDHAALDDRLRYAVLVILESLSPAERTAWVLHDMFELPFSDVARVVGRTPAAVRQLAARARRHVADHAARFEVASAEHDRVVEQFVIAASGGSLANLLRLLDPDVELYSDGGGDVRSAPRPVLGAQRVARFVIGAAGRLRPKHDPVEVAVNRGRGLAVFRGTELTDVLAFSFARGRIARIDWVRAPRKLERASRSQQSAHDRTRDRNRGAS